MILRPPLARRPARRVTPLLRGRLARRQHHRGSEHRWRVIERRVQPAQPRRIELQDRAVIRHQTIHLALDIGAYAGFSFGVPRNGLRGPGLQFIGFGTVEPGVVGSYFIKDNIEIFFGFLLPVTISGGPGFVGNIGFNFMAGATYTLKIINLGIYARLDGGPTLTIVDTGTAVLGTVTGVIGLEAQYLVRQIDVFPGIFGVAVGLRLVHGPAPVDRHASDKEFHLFSQTLGS